MGVASYRETRRICPDAVAGDASDAGFLDVAGGNQALGCVSYTEHGIVENAVSAAVVVRCVPRVNVGCNSKLCVSSPDPRSQAEVGFVRDGDSFVPCQDMMGAGFL